MVKSKEPQTKMALQGGLGVCIRGRLWVCCSAVWLWWAESTAGSVPCLVCPVQLLRDSPVAVQTLLQVVVFLLV